jgi:predicted RNase H-like nuclease (RuvC/YqgF family)
MSSFDDTYEYMLDIIETLESKINYLESHLLNSLQSKLKINNNYIELLETKLESEFSKNEKLNATIISLETKLKDQID